MGDNLGYTDAMLTAGVPCYDLYAYCKHRGKPVDYFNDLCSIRASVWKDMDDFDRHMKNFVFRVFYRFSSFYKNERILKKQAKLYWSGRIDIPDEYMMYYNMAKQYSDDVQFDVFFRLLKWYNLYLSD